MRPCSQAPVLPCLPTGEPQHGLQSLLSYQCFIPSGAGVARVLASVPDSLPGITPSLPVFMTRITPVLGSPLEASRCQPIPVWAVTRPSFVLQRRHCRSNISPCSASLHRVASTGSQKQAEFLCRAYRGDGKNKHQNMEAVDFISVP